MNTEKSDNKSLVIYTSLIFIAAIIMIIVSFFAEKHLEQQYVSEVEAQNVNLSNKAALVSEENMQLVEMNRTLKETNQKITEENTALVVEKEAFLKERAGYNALFEVSEKLLNGKKNAAKALLEEIYTEDLTQEQKEIYDSLVKRSK